MIIKALFITLFITGSLFPQETEKVARAGKREISKQEFVKRFELTPQLGIQKEGEQESIKQNFLYTLIAEKLWAQKAQELGYDTLAFIRSTMNYIEKMYARDALYKSEITDKVVITDQDLIKAYFKNSIQLKVDFVVTPDKKEINFEYSLLKKGLAFDSLENHIDTSMTVSFGQMIESIEDSLYKLSPGQFTAPISTPYGWYIFRIKDKQQINFLNDDDAKKKVKKVLTERATDKIYDAFFRQFFKGKEVRTNGLLFWSIGNKLISILKDRKFKDQIADSEKVYLVDQDYTNIKKEFGNDSLKMVYIHIEGTPVTLGQFIDDFSNIGFYTMSVDSNMIRTRLNSTVKTYIEQELLANEAIRRGYRNVPEVKESVNEWRDYYLSHIFRQRFIDSSNVSDSEVLKYYSDQDKQITIPQKIKLVEILTDSLEVIEKILDDLKQGVDIKQLAHKYNKRRETINSNGETDYISINSYGDIGKIAAGMQTGEVYGPLKVPEGYSIFKLIDKKSEEKQPPKPFDQVKEELKLNLRASKLENSVTNYTIKLANDYGVEINKDLLKKIEVTHIIMFAYRYMGFGGRIVAVPLTSPFNEWVEPWLKGKTDLP